MVMTRDQIILSVNDKGHATLRAKVAGLHESAGQLLRYNECEEHRCSPGEKQCLESMIGELKPDYNRLKYDEGSSEVALAQRLDELEETD